MCILRCHSFGGRVSVAAKAGVKEMIGRKGDQIGAMSGSCKLLKESLDPRIVADLNRTGVAVVPLPPARQSERQARRSSAASSMRSPSSSRTSILLDTGHAKLMTPFFPLELLRRRPGFRKRPLRRPLRRRHRELDPLHRHGPAGRCPEGGGRATNLFCAGEKAGLLVGHTEAICTGTLAGYNAVKCARREKPLVLPDSLAVGDAIGFVRQQMREEGILGLKYTFSGSVYFERMKARGLYTTDRGG